MKSSQGRVQKYVVGISCFKVGQPIEKWKLLGTASGETPVMTG